ncbi:MAG: NAD(+) synthase [Clostridia bacterium]|nr:NAD(+) synthase [Clostridia bacterium]
MFNVEKTTKQAVEWIRDWFEQNGKDCNAVVGISGGKDSSVVAALCVAALGKERVIGVLMPNGEQSDIDCSKQLVAYLGIPNYTINVQAGVNGVLSSLENAGVELSRQTRVNLPPRVRMATLYALSQSMNGRVANTCNLSEDWVGYSTRYGDAAGDFSPLGKLTVQEVKEIGRFLRLPENLVEKAPSDGLSGKTDEDNLGFTYAMLDEYIRTGVCNDLEKKERIDRLHVMNEFKLKPIPCFEYNPEN